MKEVIQKVCRELQVTRDEAELIVATLLEQPRFEIYTKDKVDKQTATILKKKLDQLKNGMPIEYVTRKVQFMDNLLDIYPGVFIPRLETEYFIELTERLVKRSPKNILEIGTGCGAIAICLARIFPGADIIATDISMIALDNTLENMRKLELKDRITLLRINLFDGLSGKFDLIISNPPYIPSSRLGSLPESVRNFEPISAIDGGVEGVQFIKRLITQGRHFLNPHGVIAIEIDEDEPPILRNFLKASLFNSFSFKKDLFGRFRYLFIGDYKDEKSKNSN